MNDSFFMKKACDLANISISKKCGPFGCIIVDSKTNEIIGEGHNEVLLHKNPILHAEIVAISNACKNINNHVLDDCILYTSCEPCPMCMSAIYWARIKKVFYGNTKKDAENIGFDDSFIYDEISKPMNERTILMTQCESEYALNTFSEWKTKCNKLY